jgi:hypothetical protein
MCRNAHKLCNDRQSAGVNVASAAMGKQSSGSFRAECECGPAPGEVGGLEVSVPGNSAVDVCREGVGELALAFRIAQTTQVREKLQPEWAKVIGFEAEDAFGNDKSANGPTKGRL